MRAVLAVLCVVCGVGSFALIFVNAYVGWYGWSAFHLANVFLMAGMFRLNRMEL